MFARAESGLPDLTRTSSRLEPTRRLVATSRERRDCSATQLGQQYASNARFTPLRDAGTALTGSEPRGRCSHSHPTPVSVHSLTEKCALYVTGEYPGICRILRCLVAVVR